MGRAMRRWVSVCRLLYDGMQCLANKLQRHIIPNFKCTNVNRIETQRKWFRSIWAIKADWNRWESSNALWHLCNRIRIFNVLSIWTHFKTADNICDIHFTFDSKNSIEWKPKQHFGFEVMRTSNFKCRFPNNNCHKIYIHAASTV